LSTLQLEYFETSQTLPNDLGRLDPMKTVRRLVIWAGRIWYLWLLFYLLPSIHR